MKERVLFQVTVPETFTPGENFKRLHENVVRQKTLKRVDADVIIYERDDVAEGIRSDILYPPVMVRTFLRVRGINDCIEKRFMYEKRAKNDHTIGTVIPRIEPSPSTNSVNQNLTPESPKSNNISIVKYNTYSDTDVKETKSESGPLTPPTALEIAEDVDKTQTESSDDVKLIQFNFTADHDQTEAFSNRLSELGVGDPEGFGSISVIALLHDRRSPGLLNDDEVSERLKTSMDMDQDPRNKGVDASSSAGSMIQKMNPLRKVKNKVFSLSNDVQKTVKCRVAVDQLICVINAGASFTFDYVMLVIVASVIAGVGLVTDSEVAIVASMLVSPLMGPILGITFGTMISDVKMIKKALWSELIGLWICFGVGIFVGICTSHSSWNNAAEAGAASDINHMGDTEFWPNTQIATRGDWAAIYSGIVIAAFSGIGVALSVTGNNTTSLVGVAISASLLPPVVNSGILLGYGLLYPTYYDNAGDTEYMVDQRIKLFRMSGISFLLTFLNIILIIIAGIVMFKIKEVTKVKAKGDSKDFWKEQVQETRKFNQITGRDKKVLMQRFSQEYKQSAYSNRKVVGSNPMDVL